MGSPATGPAERGGGVVGALVLAGGRSERLPGAEKAALLLGGERLVDRVVTAARDAGAGACVVVGPAGLDPGVPVVQEEPAFGGPVAGIAAGLARLPDGVDDVLVLACDLVSPGAAVAALLAARRDRTPDADGVHLVDDGGRAQWLAGCYRAAALRRAVGALGQTSGRAVRDLVRPLALVGVRAADASSDIDTWEDWRRAAERPARGDR